MTRVIMNKSLLAYRQMMKKAVREATRVRRADAPDGRRRRGAVPTMPELLPAPAIELIDLSLYHGRVKDQILIETAGDFEVRYVGVTIRDEHGNLIESGNADNWPDFPDYWEYAITVPVPSGIAVKVQVTARYGLSVVGIRREETVIP